LEKTPHELLPKLFGPIRERYASRPGGYTRVLRIEPLKPDQAPSAILELVDGPRDIRFAMTARTVARNKGYMNEMTKRNVEKVTKYRPDGMTALEDMVKKVGELQINKANRDPAGNAERRWGGKV
jgi:large subunit ribosomal protein L17